MEDIIHRSRFLATLAPSPDVDTAQERVRAVREEFPDATHHCWAFLAGPPGTTARIGLSDDGEPHGTAGRPILNTLLHSDVGEVVAVVTRWFGGVQLGKGGLGRAYAGVVARALETLPTERRVELVPVEIRVGFEGADPLFRFLDGVTVLDRTDGYAPTGELEVRARIPREVLDRLRRALADFTSGRGRVTELPEPGLQGAEFPGPELRGLERREAE